MDTDNIAIQVEGVSKRYRLGQIGYGTLQADLQSCWHAAAGGKTRIRR